MKVLLRRTSTLTALVVATAGSLSAMTTLPASAAPANDNIAAAIVLGNGAVDANNATATKESGELGVYTTRRATSDPIYACYGGGSIWDKLPASATYGLLKITSASGQAGFDGAIGVWSANTTTPTVGSLEGGRGGLRVTGLNQSSLTVDLEQNKAYFVSVDTCNDTNANPVLTTGHVTFNVEVVPRPDNDNLAAATPLAEGQEVAPDLAGASTEAGEPDPYSAVSSATNPAVYACYGGSSRWYSLPGGISAVTATVAAVPAFDSTITLWSSPTATPAVASVTGVSGICPQASASSRCPTH